MQALMQKSLAKLEEDLKRRKLTSSHISALKITEFFLDFIKAEQWSTPA
jgi:translation initiation factor 2B subunit (eIF-2B alpha/beta/delta family)